MSSSPQIRLSALQLAILRILWERGEASVNEVHGALGTKRKLAPTTVATLLKRLEKRGLLTHRSAGRQFLYRSLKSADEVNRSMVSGLVEDLFGGRALELFGHLLDTQEVSPKDLARIKQMIAAKEAKELDSEAPRPRHAGGRGHSGLRRAGR